MCEEYNGHANKPTWLVFTWLSNVEHVYKHARAIASFGTESFKAFVEGYLFLDEKEGLELDLLQWVLDGVDWDELVQAFLEE